MIIKKVAIIIASYLEKIMKFKMLNLLMELNLSLKIRKKRKIKKYRKNFYKWEKKYLWLLKNQ